MRAAMRFVYAAMVIAVTVVLAKTCFGVRTSDVAKDVAQRVEKGAQIVEKGAQIVRLSPPNLERPADADRYSSRPLADQFLERDSLSTALLDELNARYRPELADFKRAAEGAGAQLVVVSFGIDGGRNMSELERRTQPTIVEACKALDVPYYDFASAMDSAIDAGAKVTIDPKVRANGKHLSRIGASIVAAEMAKIVERFGQYKSSRTFRADERPETFGDFKPRENGVEDVGDGPPYLLKTNSQGLRMDFDLRFPKTKQRILLMGSSLAYAVFLDNDKTPTALLQARYPDKEFLNAGMFAYNIRDERDLFVDKAQFAEPDLVIVQQNGLDVVRLFFSIRNFQDRAKGYHPPSPLEKSWYLAHFPAK